MTGVVTNFGVLGGVTPIPLSTLDTAFLLCAPEADLVTLQASVAALPSSVIPLKPKAGGAAGVATDLARSDHQHPPQSAAPNLQTGTTYTLAATDDGGVVDIANSGAITLTLPNNAAIGFSCVVVQGAAGQITFSVTGGGSYRQRQTFTKTAGQWAVVTLFVRTNAGGTSAEWVAAGDMA